MKVLITGAFGYLGGRLAQHLASQPDIEVVMGTREQAEPPAWLPQAKIVQTRWESPTRLAAACAGVDAAVHLAGMNAQDCAANPVEALTVNGVATARLLQSAVNSGVRRFVYLSTAHVYRSPLTGLVSETTCPLNLHPYATSHRAGEDSVLAEHQKGTIVGTVVRLSNAFGAPTHEKANCWMLLVNDLCRQAVTTGKLVLHSSGLQRRDFVSLTDVCRALDHLLQLPDERIGDGLFNVGGAWSPTILEMTRRVAERVNVVTGKKPPILREVSECDKPEETLEYDIKKLTNSGYSLGDSSSIDREIDALIRFCIDHFTPRP